MQYGYVRVTLAALLSFKLQALATVTLLYLANFDSFKENEVRKIRGDVRAEVCIPGFKCSRTSSLHKLSINSVGISEKEIDSEY